MQLWQDAVLLEFRVAIRPVGDLSCGWSQAVTQDAWSSVRTPPFTSLTAVVAFRSMRAVLPFESAYGHSSIHRIRSRASRERRPCRATPGTSRRSAPGSVLAVPAPRFRRPHGRGLVLKDLLESDRLQPDGGHSGCGRVPSASSRSGPELRIRKRQLGPASGSSG